MIIFKVEGMHCAGCVARIEKALAEENLRAFVNLNEHTVAVEGGKEDAQKVAELLEDLGFDAVPAGT